MTVIANNTVLVTGANRGIGREFVTQLLDRGAATVYAGARNPASVEISDPRVVPVALDVTDATSVTNAADITRDVGIVINNAGISTPTPVLSADTRNIRRELEVNLFGPLAVTTAFLDQLTDNHGAVVNISSALAWISLGASYSVSKAALWSATDSMRVDLAARGIQVVGVYMGYVDTDMTAAVTDPKSAPGDIVRQVLDGLESDADEVLADQIARDLRASLSASVPERYAPFLAAGEASSS